MATEIIAEGEGRRESAVQTIGAGEVHTLIPFAQGGNWKVEVLVENSEGEFSVLGFLPGGSPQEQIRQLQGPLSYKAAARNCGLSVETGA